MREDFLHYLWKYRIINSQIQYTRTGQRVEIVHPGMHNHDAGPDFFNARVRIDELEWAGNVEIHVKSSDWTLHGHAGDRAYDNVILHVVYDDDKPVSLNKTKVPTLQLKGNFNVSILEKYEALRHEQSFVPCSGIIKQNMPDTALIGAYMDRMYVEKLEGKMEQITGILATNNGGWEETFYQVFARSMGQGKNRLPFELLARVLPLHIIGQHSANLVDLEALFFGQAGFLTGAPGDNYMKSLCNKYEKLGRKYSLHGIDEHLWKFGRLRPGNFPTLRIAQLAGFFYRKRIKLADILKINSLDGLVQLLSVEASPYWAHHSKFERITQTRSPRLGRSSVEGLLINAVIPIIFVYGRMNGRPELEERALGFMEVLRGESNSILSKWKNLGFSICSAKESQALLHLKREYCDHKKCLSCAFGASILSHKYD